MIQVDYIDVTFTSLSLRERGGLFCGARKLLSSLEHEIGHDAWHIFTYAVCRKKCVGMTGFGTLLGDKKYFSIRASYDHKNFVCVYNPVKQWHNHVNPCFRDSRSVQGCQVTKKPAKSCQTSRETNRIWPLHCENLWFIIDEKESLQRDHTV